MSGFGLGLLALFATGLAAEEARSHAGNMQDTAAVVVHGQVRMEAYRAGPALPGAIIELRQDGRLLRAVSDPEGRYRIEGLTGGRPAHLQVRHMAAEPHQMELLLPMRGTMAVDLELERRVIALSSVGILARGLREVAARPTAPFTDSDPRHPRVRLLVMESTTGLVESGLAARGRSDPPGEESPPPERALLMRGSTVDSRMVLLDGAPVLTPFHMAGLVPSFDVRSLHQADVYLGGAPARFEGGLSYVLDVESRPADADAPRFDVALDGLALRGGLNLAREDRAGLTASVRHFHGAQAALIPASTLPYSFRDALVRGDLSLGSVGELRVTGFRNREGVLLDPGAFSELGGGIASSTGADGPSVGIGGERTEWGNDAGSIRWRIGSDGVRAELLAAVARYSASLPIDWEDPVFARTRSDRHRVDLRFQRPWSEGFVRWGASYEQQALHYSLSLAGDQPSESTATARLADGPAVIRGERVGLFGESEWMPAPSVRVRAGGRADHFGHGGGLRFSPRAAVVVALTDDARLTVSGGTFHQYVPEPGLQEDARGAPPSELRWNAGLGVASARHLVMELDQELSPELAFGVSGFIKRFEESARQGGGRINASGTDLRVRRQGDRVEGWVGYALSWYWEPGSGAGSAFGRGGGFSGRHLLTSGARYEDPSGFQVGLSLEYGAGLPLTEVPMAPSPRESGDGNRTFSGGPNLDDYARSNTDNPLDLVLEDDFLRLDLEASWLTRPRVAGRTTELRPYVRVLNALDRRDALFHYFDRWRGAELRPMAQRPLLPLIGLEWRF